jgi:hypothetical protein
MNKILTCPITSCKHDQKKKERRNATIPMMNRVENKSKSLLFTDFLGSYDKINEKLLLFCYNAAYSTILGNYGSAYKLLAF